MNTLASNVSAILTSLFASASKVVFMLIAGTLCAGFLWGRRISEEHFFAIALSVFSYYYGKSVGSQIDPTIPAPTQLPPTTTETHITSATPAMVPGVK